MWRALLVLVSTDAPMLQIRVPIQRLRGRVDGKTAADKYTRER